MREYVVWGNGRNGKILYEMLGKGRIIAYIESNPMFIGQEYKGIPIISFSDYLESFSGIPVIISAFRWEEEIARRLGENHVGEYYFYSVEAGDIQFFCLQANRERLFEKLKKDVKISCVGRPILADLLQDYLTESGCGKDKIVCSERDARGCISVERLFLEEGVCRHPELQKFKNIHKGKRCFIVATGPSLAYRDLEKLHGHGEICISVNGIFKAFPYTSWRPDYYIASDPSAILQWHDDIRDMEVPEKFVADIAYFFEEDIPNLHRWHLAIGVDDGRPPVFSDDFSEASHIGYTIVYDGALQLAVYMGFTEIYLLGVDFTQRDKDGRDHFVEGYQGVGFQDAVQDLDRQLLAYQSAKKYADGHGICIYNATRGGALEVFERIDFDGIKFSEIHVSEKKSI